MLRVLDLMPYAASLENGLTNRTSLKGSCMIRFNDWDPEETVWKFSRPIQVS